MDAQGTTPSKAGGMNRKALVKQYLARSKKNCGEYCEPNKAKGSGAGGVVGSGIKYKPPSPARRNRHNY